MTLTTLIQHLMPVVAVWPSLSGYLERLRGAADVAREDGMPDPSVRVVGEDTAPLYGAVLAWQGEHTHDGERHTDLKIVLAEAAASDGYKGFMVTTDARYTEGPFPAEWGIQWLPEVSWDVVLPALCAVCRVRGGEEPAQPTIN